MARTITLNKTYAEMQGLMTANSLDTQTNYKITDRGDNGLIFRAATVNRLEFDGIRYMLCPATYATGLDAYANDWIGAWNATKGATATEGQLCIWNGLAWVAGAVMDGLAPDTGTSGWTVIPKATFTNHEYVELIFGVTYDFDNDWICKQWDTDGNVFGMGFLTETNSYNLGFNVCDYTDWNIKSLGNIFSNNKCIGFYNNDMSGDINDNTPNGIIYENVIAELAFNKNNGDIWANTGGSIIKNNFNNGIISENIGVGFITDNINNGDISQNTCLNIQLNSNSDDISGNSNNGDISHNSNNGYISSNSSVPLATCNIQFNYNNGSITGSWDADVSDAVVNKTGTA